MNNDYRRFAPAGLVLSAMALISLIGFLLVSALSSAGLFVLPNPDILTQGRYISLGLVVVGLALAALLDPERARKFFTGRQAQYGSNSLIMLIAFLGILFFVNMLAYNNPKSWDLTADKLNTLAPETVDTLQALPEAVSVRAYYTSRNPADTQLLDRFKQASDGKFDYQVIDPELNPVAAQEDGIDRDGTLVLQMGPYKELVTYPTEQDITGAMVRLMNPQNRVMYFLTGHGERDTENYSETSYTNIKRALESKNYTVKLLNLASQGTVPADAQAVIVAGPIQPLLPAESEALGSYFANGGGLIVMNDPLALTNFGEQADPLADMLQSWGIVFNNDLVIDPSANPAIFAVADPQNYGQHPITAKLRGLTTVFPTTRSLAATDSPYLLTPLAITGESAWGEADMDSINSNQVAYDEGTDTPGPLTLAIAAENQLGGGRLVVFGDSEFAADALYERGNGDILLNAIDWAAEQENLISLTPKNTVERTYEAPTTFGLIGIVLTSLCLIPLAVLAGGISSWLSRRRRG